VTMGAESVGEVVTGALVARAVEPDAGEGHGSGTKCLNCGAALTGPFCQECGQSAHVHRTLHAFWHDLAHAVLHFEGKIWQTLPLLAWHPGELTRRYIAGERVRFVSPMAIFLFSAFLMLATIHTIGGPLGEPTVHSDSDPAEIRAEYQATQRELAKLEAKRAQRLKEHRSTEDVDEDIEEARDDLSGLQIAQKASDLSKDELTIEGDGKAEQLARRIVGKAKDDPELLAYKLQNNAYKFSWALIPISVPFVWMLFAFRRRYKAYDHTIFVTYSIAAMTLLVVGLSALRWIGFSQALVLLGLVILPPLHMYRQLREAYELSHGAALWRAGLLVCFALVSGLLFFMLLTVLGSGD
jgi:Protein of unknown function (DUF3667)